MKNRISANEAGRLWRHDGGATMVEFTLVMMLLFSITFAIVEFALYNWQLNAAEKATEMAVRLAVESDPVASGFATYSGVVDGGLDPGTDLTTTLVPAFTLTCTDTACSCSEGSCTQVGTARSVGAFDAILARARAIFPRIQAQNLVVEYRHVGLGFAGRPGPDLVPVVAVRLRNLNYNVAAMTAFGVPATLPLTTAPSVMTAEDLNSLAPS
ncbi:MAG TPA: TadE/TadG family type IV pilus assembly protein [Azospirillaceae bacterium]|nr:TadE/TadG family type IV pilus assembly protein [Azospirillaceae bacterium]